MREGDTESFAAIVPDGLLSGTDIDMPCQGLLSTFFRRQSNQLAVGSTTKRQLHQNLKCRLKTSDDDVAVAVVAQGSNIESLKQMQQRTTTTMPTMATMTRTTRTRTTTVVVVVVVVIVVAAAAATDAASTHVVSDSAMYISFESSKQI